MTKKRKGMMDGYPMKIIFEQRGQSAESAERKENDS